MSESTPICRCRVLYLGSSVPQQTKDGLQGIQEPLQELYPDQGATGAKGIDSWLSVWSNGILLENVDENHKKITRFFPIESLHYCAAVRYVLVPEKNTLHSPSPRFLPLDSPFARAPNPIHPPLFAAILRRTTGIKVLECHAFICKREVAANALVRCCFHAYADSSYAKQVDTAGSIYGTLASASERLTTTTTTINKDKLDEWKINRLQSDGSTMTINTIGIDGDGHSGNNNNNNNNNQKDDNISIYNGDENHKVWAGSQDNLDGIYDIYSTSTSINNNNNNNNRQSRPRQISQPVVVPPPPPPPPLPSSNKDKRKNNKLLIKQKNINISTSKEDLYHHPTHHHHYGSSIVINGKASSISGGTIMKTHHHHQQQQQQQQPIYIMSSSHQPSPLLNQTLPNQKFFKQHHHNTFSHRPRGKMLIPARPIQPQPPLVIPTSIPKKSKKIKQHIINNNNTMEEPIYMPSNRALSPIASYQPINFPHEAYLMQHYATMENQGNKNNKGRRNNNNNNNNKKILNKNKLAQSMNGLDNILLSGQQQQQQQHHHQGPSSQSLQEDESPFNTGIYKKKGHLNERAFSYSIRQEHRSRSYGSLANLKFASPIPNNGDNNVVEDREDIKKEREIMQMVQDLDLSGDELERSEVPKNMYERGGLSAPVIITSASQLNGIAASSNRNYR